MRSSIKLLWLMPCAVAFISVPSLSSGLDFEIEPNNISEQAMAIEPGQAIQGNIAAVDDADVFSFQAEGDGSVRVFFRRPPVAVQFNIARIRVLDDQGTALGIFDAFAPNVYTTFDFGVVDNQVYFLELTGCQRTDEFSECPEHRSEAYELSVVQLPSPRFEAEQNGTLATANSISPNAWLFAQHSSFEDIDFFSIEIPTPGNLFAQVSRPSDGFKYSLGNIAIVDSSGILLNSDDIYAPDGQGRVVLGIDEPGTYYLKLTSCQSSSRCDLFFSNQYQIAVSFLPSSLCELLHRDGFETCI